MSAIQRRRLSLMRRFQRFNTRLYQTLNGIRKSVRVRLGYRGLILMSFGLIYIMIGLSVIAAHDYAPELVHTHLPKWFRIGLWCVPGLIAVLVAPQRNRQNIGFAVMFLPPAERAISYGVAVITVPTLTRVPAALIYLIIVVTITFFAAWPEPADTSLRRRTIVGGGGKEPTVDDLNAIPTSVEELNADRKARRR